MIKDFSKALEEEKRYVADHMNGIDTNLLERLKCFGYETLSEYFTDKKQYNWNNWKPEIRRTDIAIVAEEVERAIREKDYGVYIPTVSGVYAFYGINGVDKELCRELNVRPVNMGYRGGIIIGSDEDFAIEIVMPASLNIRNTEIMNKMVEIISQYVDNVSIDNNDILVDGKKVMGCVERHIDNVYTWAAQVSFGDYTEYISKICKKPVKKQPSKINRNHLSREKLEQEVLKWLLKQ
jgi:hypothetical protein